MELSFAAVTSTGKVRETNQDAVLAVAAPGARRWLLAVADGVGGLVDGAETSHFLVDELAAAAAGSRYCDSLADAAERCILDVNARVNAKAAASGRQSGTTIVLAAIEHDAISILHAGDSRAYLLRDGMIHRLTDDHSWVEEQVRAGKMSPDEAAASPYRNIITRCVGIEPILAVTRSTPTDLNSGDIVLLSSDGLHGLVAETVILELLETGGPVGELAQALVDRANEAGGTDNISVVLARVEANPGFSSMPTVRVSRPLGPDMVSCPPF